MALLGTAWFTHCPTRLRVDRAEGLLRRRAGDPRISPRDRAFAEDLSERIELIAGQAHPHDANRRLVKHLANEADALFTFLADAEIDATNWRGEQAIRPAVVNRKAWGGNRTRRGAATQGRIMSAIRTAAQQGIDPVDFVIRPARAPDPDAVSLFA